MAPESMHMLLKTYMSLFGRRFLRRRSVIVIFIVCIIFIHRQSESMHERFHTESKRQIIDDPKCDICISTDSFLRLYRSKNELARQVDPTRAEPNVKRLRTLLQIVRDKEAEYQPLLRNFGVFDMTDPMQTIENNERRNSNVEEMKLMYSRYIRLTDDKKTVIVNESFVDYLRTVSSYLSDGLRDQRTSKVGMINPYD